MPEEPKKDTDFQSNIINQQSEPAEPLIVTNSEVASENEPYVEPFESTEPMQTSKQSMPQPEIQPIVQSFQPETMPPESTVAPIVTTPEVVVEDEPYVEPFESTEPLQVMNQNVEQPMTQPIVQPVEQSMVQPIQPIAMPASQPMQPLVQPLPVQPILNNPATAAATNLKKSKKGLILGIALVGILALLGGGSALAYNVWYQNPQKMISDALINAVTAKSSIYTGTINFDSGSTKVTVDVSTKQSSATGSLDATLTMDAGGTKYSIIGSALVDASGDLYFKANKLDSVAVIAKSMLSSADPDGTMVDGLVAKINDKWIKISSDDLKQFSSSFATTKTCLNDTVSKFKDDKSAIAEVTNLYQKDTFITDGKSLGVKDGSYGFQVKFKITALNAFFKGLEDTKIYKSIKSCDSTFSIDQISDTTVADSANNSDVFDLWIDGWSHQITKVTVKSPSSDSTQISGSIIPKYNQTINITTPSTFITLTDLKSYIEEAVQSVYAI